jgi:Amt family ammonium transporter
MGFTIVMAVVGTLVIGSIVKAVVGLRPAPDVERQGLDIHEHGEEGYILE